MNLLTVPAMASNPHRGMSPFHAIIEHKRAVQKVRLNLRVGDRKPSHQSASWSEIERQ
jgi:hypothetical protein